MSMTKFTKFTLMLTALLTLSAGAWAQESNEITVSPVTGQTNQWTFTMPDGNVELTPIYEPEFTATFKAGNANTIQSGKATVTVTESGATEGTDVTDNIGTDNKLTPVYEGQTITLTAKPGYKFKSVEVKKGSTTPLDNTTTAWTAGTFAVPAGGLTYSEAITVSGDVTLTLTDGETLTLNKGISIAAGATLTIQGNGTMNVNGTNSSTASTVAGNGTLVLTSGTLTAKGGNGGGYRSYEAIEGSKSAGGVAINGAVTVSGGTLTATGGAGGSIAEYNSEVIAGAGGAAISGSVTLSSGTLTATGGNGGNGGQYSDGDAGAGGAAIGGDLTVNGGTKTTTNGSNGVGSDMTAVHLGAGGKAVAGTETDNR